MPRTWLKPVIPNIDIFAIILQFQFLKNITHRQKIARIAGQLKERRRSGPVSFKKKAVSHRVPNPKDKRYGDEKIDLSDLNEIISIDVRQKICIAEPGVTFVDLVKATLRFNLVPIVVPELKTITIGGAVAGCSLESMSYKYGGFHDACLEYEVITALGKILICTPRNKHRLLFQMVNGSFGTLGVISKLTFKLIPAQRFVHIQYQTFDNLQDYQIAIWQHYQDKDIDFMDGMIHSQREYILCLGNFARSAPYTHNYGWTRVYFKSTQQRKEDYLKTIDYFFRYENGVTNVWPQSYLGRVFFGKIYTSTNVLRIAEKFRKIIPLKKIPVTTDLMIPFSKLPDFFEWYNKQINFYPLWCVPYRVVRKYELLSKAFFRKSKDKLFVDIALYGMSRKNNENYYKISEKKLMDLGGVKALLSWNYYSKKDFWKIWNKKNYNTVKRQTDPKNIFRDLYTKTCRTMMGLK